MPGVKTRQANVSGERRSCSVKNTKSIASASESSTYSSLRLFMRRIYRDGSFRDDEHPVLLCF